ncbi:peptide-methionine (S)-S-oxide reductase MsrA [Marinigracilibium pacificum]|uniref:Peptide methionine sulfoxide reductase MsrA n=1 Tax=Marinigracilibium pacificum TaxID=2729599 RepID=A0A848J2L5_9BACT|nr:peptide-methionine (S)-S-oxide reductase MsrA [Marinigracilibium pacificum]NMM50016.1 peptide-methionine (S)-S-oxide reductase MsrA [Marinigracilibium pacificum]
MEKISLGAGCFWCIEAVLQRMKGINRVKSGYMGGHVKNPPYREVAMGTTGHAEVVEVEYDPSIVKIEEILEVFWNIHDPTTLNRQGYDVGTQYRSAIFYYTEHQRLVAEEYKMQLDKMEIFENPVVTEITPAGEFYPAEVEHDNYYNDHPEQPYCNIIIRPKVEKFNKLYPDKRKEN